MANHTHIFLFFCIIIITKSRCNLARLFPLFLFCGWSWMTAGSMKNVIFFQSVGRWKWCWKWKVSVVSLIRWCDNYKWDCKLWSKLAQFAITRQIEFVLLGFSIFLSYTIYVIEFFPVFVTVNKRYEPQSSGVYGVVRLFNAMPKWNEAITFIIKFCLPHFQCIMSCPLAWINTFRSITITIVIRHLICTHFNRTIM